MTMKTIGLRLAQNQTHALRHSDLQDRAWASQYTNAFATPPVHSGPLMLLRSQLHLNQNTQRTSWNETRQDALHIIQS